MVVLFYSLIIYLVYKLIKGLVKKNEPEIPLEILFHNKRKEYTKFRPNHSIKNKSEQKGLIGEKYIHEQLLTLGNKYIVLHNVYVPKLNGEYSQIDHLVISQYGIFAIETKNYSGAIFGDERENEWKQVLNGKSYYFYNPLKQNQKHIHFLKNYFKHKKIHRCQVNSIITFSNNVEFNLSRDLKDDTLLHFEEVTNHIKKYQNTIINKIEMRKILNAIEPLASDTEEERKEKAIIHSNQFSSRDK